MRRETKEASIYALTAAKSGPTLKPSDTSIDCSAVTPNALLPCHVVRSGTRGIHGDRVDMNDLVPWSPFSSSSAPNGREKIDPP